MTEEPHFCLASAGSSATSNVPVPVETHMCRTCGVPDLITDPCQKIHGWQEIMEKVLARQQTRAKGTQKDQTI